MNMLDATAIADPDDYTKDDFRDKGLVIRRFKKDIRNQVRNALRDRNIVRRRFPASAGGGSRLRGSARGEVSHRPESEAGQTGRRKVAISSSSPWRRRCSPARPPASSTVDRRLRQRRERELDPITEPAGRVRSRVVARPCGKALTAIRPEDYAKYQALLAAVRGKQAVRMERERPAGPPRRVHRAHRHTEVAARPAREGPATPWRVRSRSSTAD